MHTHTLNSNNNTKTNNNNKHRHTHTHTHTHIHTQGFDTADQTKPVKKFRPVIVSKVPPAVGHPPAVATDVTLLHVIL
jgi:hypothetical protein